MFDPRLSSVSRSVVLVNEDSHDGKTPLTNQPTNQRGV